MQTAVISINSTTGKVRKQRQTTTLKYLYEVAAVPEVKRAELLGKLLKRRNAGNQVNVKLLKLIYEHVNENKILKWDDDSICLKLGISRDMLYCHKSWLLRKLRMLYFGWEKAGSAAEVTKKKGPLLLSMLSAETDEAKRCV